MWISVEDRLPVLSKTQYHTKYSENYPIKIKGRDGWQIGYLYQAGTDVFWIKVGFHGDYTVTDWYDLPDPPETEHPTAPNSESEPARKARDSALENPSTGLFKVKNRI